MNADPSDGPLLSRRRLLDALGRLGDYLRDAGVVADLHIVGGAVMVTEYGARDATADVDAFDYQPHGAVQRAAHQVADEMGLPRSWLNQQASVYVPRAAHWRRSLTFDHPNLHLYAIAPEQLLAMKVQAGRPTDAEDIETLCRELAIISADEVKALVRRAYPDDEPSARGLELVWDILGR
ncbi:MAG: nucleotidyltransferase [Sporichthyaceae bacterium]